MDKLAEELDEDTEQLLERWRGSPEKIAEDVFRTRNMETREMEPLKLFSPYQPQLLHSYFYGDETITNVYKGRRIGVSFIFCVAITLDAYITPDANFAIVSRTKGQSEERLKDILTLLENAKFTEGEMDDWLNKNNNGELVFPNGSSIVAFSGDPKSARGMDSAKTVFIDEMAWLDDQKETLRAFQPFVNLGSHRQMLQVSTPRASNDTFLSTNQKGSPAGKEGVIAIKQPSFKDPESIEINKPLLEQDVEPVRPDMDVPSVEVERAQDPQGFAQEYLCRPIADEYRFFTSDGIRRAIERGAESVDPRNGPTGKKKGEKAYWHPATHSRLGGEMIMGVDIGIDRDDTAIAVFEHAKGHRYLRFHTLLDVQDLQAVGMNTDRVDDPSTVARYINRVVENMGVDRVYLDKTGPGKGFQKEVEKRLGRKSFGFNFSDKDEIKRMMGDFNYALHNDLITLVPDDAIKGQLEAIVKEQRHETSKAKFSGKDHAPNGKDDLAMALVLGAYPPNYDEERDTEPHQRENTSGYEDVEPDMVEGSEQSGFKAMLSGGSASGEDTRPSKTNSESAFGLTPDTGTSRRYSRRHSR